MASHGIKDRVAIVGMGCTPFREHWDKGVDDLSLEASNEAFAAAGITKDDVDAYWLGTATSGMSGITLARPLQLTGKRIPRYVSIFNAYRRRLDIGDMSAITYLCNRDSARAVRDALGSIPAGRAIAPQVVVREVYDERGLWDGDDLPTWMLTARARVDHQRRSRDSARPMSAE